MQVRSPGRKPSRPSGPRWPPEVPSNLVFLGGDLVVHPLISGTVDRGEKRTTAFCHATRLYLVGICRGSCHQVVEAPKMCGRDVLKLALPLLLSSSVSWWQPSSLAVRDSVGLCACALSTVPADVATVPVRLHL